METRRRSIAKALSWRFLATLITTAVAYSLTGGLAFAAKIGVIDTAVKVLIYFAHERTWQRISYGKIETPDYQI